MDSGSATSLPILSDKVIADGSSSLDDEYVFRTYLAEYGSGSMLAGWKSGGQLQIAVLDKETGEMTRGPVPVEAGIDQFQEFVSYPNGDVGWAWGENGASEIRIVRIKAAD
jgi:hypothetical protein